MLLKDLYNKNIAIWGLGHEGKACLDYLQKHQLGKSIKIFETDQDVNLKDVDIIIKSPGVSIYKEEIIAAKKQGISITSSSDLFLNEVRSNQPHCKIIGISGSKGKSTSVSALYHILQSSGYKVGLGGNIGKPIIELIDGNYDYVVGEFSSYQATDLTASPHIVMFTNLFSVHNEWHHGHENYCRDKVHLIANQQPGDIFFVNARNQQLKDYCEPYTNGKNFYNTTSNFHSEGKTLYQQDQKLFNIKELKLSGDHNLDNLAGVFSILKVLNFDLNNAIAALKDFEPLAHRLQQVGTHNQVSFINDSISTAPEAAIGAMKSFDGNIAIISGGQDLQQDYSEYADFIAQNSKIKMVTCLFQSGPEIANSIKRHPLRQDFELTEGGSLENAVQKSYQKLADMGGGTILFSPTAPSFGVYKNFMERGNHFISIVQKLQNEFSPTQKWYQSV